MQVGEWLGHYPVVVPVYVITVYIMRLDQIIQTGVDLIVAKTSALSDSWQTAQQLVGYVSRSDLD